MSTRVVTARTHQSARQVLHMLSAHHISGMPVVNEDGELAGLISQSDLMAHLASGGDLLVEIGALMAPFICFATPDATLEEAADLMLEHGIHRVVVLRAREVAGIVTSLDLLRGLRQS